MRQYAFIAAIVLTCLGATSAYADSRASERESTNDAQKRAVVTENSDEPESAGDDATGGLGAGESAEATPANEGSSADDAAARRNTTTRALAAQESKTAPPAPATRPPRRTGYRLTKEVRGGALGLSIGASVGSTIGMLIAAMDMGSDSAGSDVDQIEDGLSNFLFYTIVGGVVGAYLGIPGGVYAGGSSERDSDGSLWITYLGGLAGAGASLGVLSFMDSSNSGVTNLLLVGTALATPFIGSMLGYELSDSGPQGYSSISAPIPTIGISPDGDGGYVGLGLQF